MASSVSKKPTVELKTQAELEKMKKAGEIAGTVLHEVGKQVRAGVTTKELDRLAEKLIRKAGAIPTFIGYHGYPSSICVSINEEVVHGMPSDRVIKEGDIVSVDIGATFDGYVGDTAYTFLVEPVSVEARKLVQATKESLDAAIEMMKPGKRLGDIGAAVQKFVEAKGYGVVRDFVGHGIGRQMHESPAVPNYGDAGSGMRLETGLVLAIEPMVTQGSHDVNVLKDGWTVVTKDGSLAAHFEHTVAVTDNGPWVLTAI
jgi:methionyl aminopeptidase